MSSVLQRAMMATEDVMRRLGLSKGAGTGANQIVKLDGSGKLPAVDGSNLTNISGGSGLPPGADADVTSEAELNTALAANQVAYVSTNITITSTIDLTGKKIIWKPGITVTFDSALSINAGFTVGDDGEFESSVFGTVNFVAQHFGSFIGFNGGSGDGSVYMKGRYALACVSGSNNFNTVGGWIESLVYSLPNAVLNITADSSNYLSIDFIRIIGGGSSSYIRATYCTIQSLKLSGTFRAYSSGLQSNYAFEIRLGSVENLLRTGTGSVGIHAEDAKIGLAASISASDTYVGATEGGEIGGVSGSNIRSVSNDSTEGKNYFGPGDIENLEAEGASIGQVFNGVNFINATTVPSGAGITFRDCQFANFTNSSGSSSRFLGCTFNGTFSNADGINSLFVNCENSSGERWMNNDGRIEFKPTSTTDATKTQLYIDASSLQFLLNSNDVAQIGFSLISVRDNQDEAIFTSLAVITAKNDGGTTTVTAPGSLVDIPPDDSDGTGSTLTMDIEADDTNDAIAFYISANASENWDHRPVITFNLLNN